MSISPIGSPSAGWASPLRCRLESPQFGRLIRARVHHDNARHTRARGHRGEQNAAAPHRAVEAAHGWSSCRWLLVRQVRTASNATQPSPGADTVTRSLKRPSVGAGPVKPQRAGRADRADLRETVALRSARKYATPPVSLQSRLSSPVLVFLGRRRAQQPDGIDDGLRRRASARTSAVWRLALCAVADDDKRPLLRTAASSCRNLRRRRRKVA